MRANILVDGHHRHRIASKHRIPFKITKGSFQNIDDVRIWMIRQARARRNLSKYDQVLLCLQEQNLLREKARDNQRTRSRFSSSCIHEKLHVDEAIAQNAGCSTQTVHRVRFVSQNGTPDIFHDLQSGAISINRAYRDLRLEMKDRGCQRRIQGQLETLKKAGNSDSLGIHHGRFQDLGKDLAAGSVSLVLTDPPYGSSNVSIYSDLARFAKRVLKPGGILACFSGQLNIPEVLSLMTPHLRYLWVIACVNEKFDGSRATMLRPLGIKSLWKPIWLFAKEARKIPSPYLDDIIHSRKQKSNHEWEQGSIEADYLIEKLSKGGDLVVDPMVGSGTTVTSAQRLHRRWWGCDVDERAVLLSRKRLSEALGTNS